jgi:hypothetical protein
MVVHQLDWRMVYSSSLPAADIAVLCFPAPDVLKCTVLHVRFFCIADSLELKSYVIGHQKAISHADGTSAIYDPSSGLDPTLPLLHNGSSYCEKW